MSPWKSIKNLLYKADFFYTTQLFRYGQESDFRTLTGGICWLSIIAIIMALLITMTLQTFNRQSITYSLTEDKEEIPSAMEIKLDGENFMVGVQILGINLNDQERYFDIQIATYEQTKYENGTATVFSRELESEQCRPEHFRLISGMQESYTRLKSENWICPKINQSFILEGKYAAPSYKLLGINILKCNQSKDPSRPCKNQSEVSALIDQNGGFYFTIYFSNLLINPSSQTLRSNFLDDNNYMKFSNTITSEAYIFIEEYTITTDNSLLPYQQNEIIRGPIATKNAFQYPQTIFPDIFYGSFYLGKASSKYSYLRSFQKFDQVFSYVGGLFGSIIALMFVMKFYTSFSYEISLGSHLFNLQNDESIKSDQFNICRFIGYTFYNIARAFGINFKWKIMETFDDCRAEIKQQLDVKLLLQRLTFFERAFLLLFDDHQFKALHLQKKLTIIQSKELRHHYLLKKKLKIKEQVGEPAENDDYEVTGKNMVNSMMEPREQKNIFGRKNQQPHQNRIKTNKIAPLFVRNNFQEEDLKLDDCIILKRENKEYQQADIVSLDHDFTDNESYLSQSSDAKKSTVHITRSQLDRLRDEGKSGNDLSEKIWKKIDRVGLKTLINLNRQPQLDGQIMVQEIVDPSKDKKHQRQKHVTIQEEQ